MRLRTLFQTNQISREDSIAYLFSLLSKEPHFIQNGSFLVKEMLANGLVSKGGLNSLTNAMSNLRNFIGMKLFEIQQIPESGIVEWLVKNISNMVHYFSLLFNMPVVHLISKNIGKTDVYCLNAKNTKDEALAPQNRVNFMIFIHEERFEINLALITETEVQAIVNHQVDMLLTSEEGENQIEIQEEAVNVQKRDYPEFLGQQAQNLFQSKMPKIEIKQQTQNCLANRQMNRTPIRAMRPVQSQSNFAQFSQQRSFYTNTIEQQDTETVVSVQKESQNGSFMNQESSPTNLKAKQAQNSQLLSRTPLNLRSGTMSNDYFTQQSKLRRQSHQPSSQLVKSSSKNKRRPKILNYTKRNLSHAKQKGSMGKLNPMMSAIQNQTNLLVASKGKEKIDQNLKGFQHYLKGDQSEFQHQSYSINMHTFSNNLIELSKLPQMKTPACSAAKQAKNIEIEEFESLEDETENLSNPEEPNVEVHNINIEIPADFSVNESSKKKQPVVNHISSTKKLQHTASLNKIEHSQISGTGQKISVLSRRLSTLKKQDRSTSKLSNFNSVSSQPRSPYIQKTPVHNQSNPHCEILVEDQSKQVKTPSVLDRTLSRRQSRNPKTASNQFLQPQVGSKTIEISFDGKSIIGTENEKSETNLRRNLSVNSINSIQHQHSALRSQLRGNISVYQPDQGASHLKERPINTQKLQSPENGNHFNKMAELKTQIERIVECKEVRTTSRNVTIQNVNVVNKGDPSRKIMKNMTRNKSTVSVSRRVRKNIFKDNRLFVGTIQQQSNKSAHTSSRKNILNSTKLNLTNKKRPSLNQNHTQTPSRPITNNSNNGSILGRATNSNNKVTTSNRVLVKSPSQQVYVQKVNHPNPYQLADAKFTPIRIHSQNIQRRPSRQILGNSNNQSLLPKSIDKLPQSKPIGHWNHHIRSFQVDGVTISKQFHISNSQKQARLPQNLTRNNMNRRHSSNQNLLLKSDEEKNWDSLKKKITRKLTLQNLHDGSSLGEMEKQHNTISKRGETLTLKKKGSKNHLRSTLDTFDMNVEMPGFMGDLDDCLNQMDKNFNILDQIL